MKNIVRLINLLESKSVFCMFMSFMSRVGECNVRQEEMMRKRGNNGCLGAVLLIALLSIRTDAMADYLWAIKAGSQVYRVDASTGSATYMWSLPGGSSSPYDVYGGLAFGNVG